MCLSGAKEGAAALAWHPRRNCMASLGESGAVFLWARTYSERWSAFAPGFSELQDNEARRPLGHSHILQWRRMISDCPQTVAPWLVRASVPPFVPILAELRL